MEAKKFDPRKFIDRDFEQKLFEELLQFKDATRILAINDQGGMGKTQLLQKLQHRCRTIKPRIPVSYITLDQLPDNSSFTLVQAIKNDLAVFGVKFPNFAMYESALVSGDFRPFRSAVSLRGADLRSASGTSIAGRDMVNVRAKKVSISMRAGTLTPEQQTSAQEVCIQVFFDDLNKCCVGSSVVLLFDAFEKCDELLEKWLMDHLLERHFFDLENRPAQLILVIAGRKPPTFDERWATEDVDAVVRSVRQLGKWEKKDVEECLRAHGINYEPKQVDFFYGLVEEGYPPSTVVLLIENHPAFGRGS